MAIKIKSGAAIAAKFAAKAGAAGKDYSDGVASPRRDYATATAAAAETYASGVQQAIVAGSFEKGVAKAGTAKWQRKAAGVGAQRFPQGAQAAQGDYQAGVQPFLDTIAALDLPPRGPKGDPGNINRVSVVANALRARKVQG
jgi:hypothetical protein